MKLAAHGSRALFGLSIFFVLSHGVSAVAVAAPAGSRQPAGSGAKHRLFVPDHVSANFSAVVALRAQKAAEENTRLARLANASGIVLMDNESRPVAALRGSLTPKASGTAAQAKVSHFVNSGGVQSLNSTAGKRNGPKVFFLFLTYSGANRMDLWEAFFSQAPREQYAIFMHCQAASVCSLKATTGGNPLGITVVPSVPSQYCTDLVSPMVQLLRNAVPLSQSPNDKFVFVSETTLPVKPFADVYNTLSQDQNSDFCFYHSEQWAQLASAERGDNAALLKHSQWVTLSKAHADVMIERWPQVLSQQSGYWSVPMSSNPGQPASMDNFVSITRSIAQCADEWAIFGTIYGAVITGSQQSINFQGLNGSPIWITGWQTQGRDQGSCRTFATWGWSSGFSSLNVAREIMADAPASALSCFPTCPMSSPASIEAISDRGLTVLRHSPFLFARKFAAQTVTGDQFQRIIMSGSPPGAVQSGATGVDSYGNPAYTAYVR